MRHFNEYHMDYDDDTGRAVLVRDELYDYDELPTVQPSADELNKWINDVVYMEQITAMVHEAEPCIAVLRNIGQMFQNGIDVEAGKHLGQIAQEAFESTKAWIERQAGIEKG